MRCPKCGYVSFDYLVRCKKCNRDLADARLALNLLDVKPATPFLLASLVGATAHDTGRERVTGLSLTQESELELANMEMPAPVGLDETMEKAAAAHGAKERTATAAAQSGPAEVETPSFDLSLDDLSLEEGDKAEGPATGADEGTLDLDLRMDDEGPGAVGDDLRLGEGTPEALSKEELDLDFDAPAESAPERKGSASDDGMPDLEEALLEMERDL